MRIKKSVFATILAVAEMARIAAAQPGALPTGSDAAPVVIPADVQMAPLVSQSFATEGQNPTLIPAPAMVGNVSVAPVTPGVVAVAGPYLTPGAPAYYVAPAQPGMYPNMPVPPGAYPNIPANWNEYSATAQPGVPVGPPPCEAVACDNGPLLRWYYNAQAVAFSRDNYARNQSLLGNFSTDDLEFDGTAAPYLALGFYVDPKNQWQLIYFNALDLSANAKKDFVGAESIVNYDSNFRSAELNYLHTWNHWSLLAGFRYLHLDEQFLIHDTNFVSSVDYDMETANDLYGGQLGFAYHREWSWLMLDVIGKFGLYGNAAVQHGRRLNNGTLTGTIDNYPGALAESGEFDFFLGHRFSPHWAGQLGLIVLEVDNLALAPDMDVSDKADGNITLVGLSIGATARW